MAVVTQKSSLYLFCFSFYRQAGLDCGPTPPRCWTYKNFYKNTKTGAETDRNSLFGQTDKNQNKNHERFLE